MKNVGSQAVLEGVMMRGSACVATSVRTTDGMIATLAQPLGKQQGTYKRLPIIRRVSQPHRFNDRWDKSNELFRLIL